MYIYKTAKIIPVDIPSFHQLSDQQPCRTIGTNLCRTIMPRPTELAEVPVVNTYFPGLASVTLSSTAAYEIKGLKGALECSVKEFEGGLAGLAFTPGRAFSYWPADHYG
ncbi:hypothetical protein ElyMa_003861000 [Elysia marginata]|uniref:Uncharacterized protein n=1 Tax=Elysia marginata TaxID=1093978 RepID=A0AAV4FIT9_9GAST|nr:hypothetical protein ElyMa_003861000 [Elysia marginata]